MARDTLEGSRLAIKRCIESLRLIDEQTSMLRMERTRLANTLQTLRTHRRRIQRRIRNGIK